MDWDDLRFLLALRDEGSASSAARKLEVDKATVTRRVNQLEQALGVRLLVRRSSGWRPTAAGERAAGIAHSMAQQVRSLSSAFADQQGAPRTQVSVTAPHWFCAELLVPNLSQLIDSSPWLDVSVAATSRVLSLPERHADVAVRNTRPDQGDFVVRKAGDLGSAIYASRAYAKSHPVPHSPEGWLAQRFIGYPNRITYVPGFRWFDELGAAARANLRTDDAKALTEALKAGLGIGIVPCFLGDREPNLVRYTAEIHREKIWLCSPAELATTRGVRLTLAFVADIFRKHAAALGG
ncbi:MAG TPA: LysR family transcriptional regulator [Polyangiaceae bacterium]|nr:LysR family transcriptional regulator [Polyangiaceae bacterium]